MLEADGSLYTKLNYNNDHVIVQKQLLTGFNNNTPQWGSATTIINSPQFAHLLPVDYLPNTRGASTNPRRFIFFEPNHDSTVGSYTGLGIGYHLGSIKTGGTSFDWLASKSTFSYFSSPSDYHGDYPRNGDFDIGNNDYGGGQHSENCRVHVYGSDIFWHVNGEFWQTNSGVTNGVNIWNHFNEDGLLIGNFGVTAYQAKTFLNNYGNAGNSYSTALVKVGSDYYIYHCDESQYGFIHSWHVTGLNTIAEQMLPITVNAAITTSPDPTDLMAGLPYRSATFTGGNGWIVDSPAALKISTSIYQYQKNSIDIFIGGAGNQVVRRSLNNTSNLSNWTLTGVAQFPDQPTIGGDNYNYLQILDVNSHVIASLQDYANTGNGYYRTQSVNGVTFNSGSNSTVGYFFKQYQDFSFSYLNGKLNVKIRNLNAISVTSPFDNNANMAAPAYIRINQGTPGNQQHSIDLYKLKFIPGS